MNWNSETTLAVIIVICWNVICMYLLNHEQQKQADKPDGKKMKFYFAAMLIANLALVILLEAVYVERSVLYLLKRMGIVTLLWSIAAVDIKEHRIPNRFLLAGLIYRAVMLAGELIWERDVLAATLASEGIALLAILLICVVCLLVMKNSIGLGDVKLMLLMAVSQGVFGIGAALFCSMLVSFFIAVFCLATHKKSRKDVIPFGPSVLIGTFLSVFLTGA